VAFSAGAGSLLTLSDPHGVAIGLATQKYISRKHEYGADFTPTQNPKYHKNLLSFFTMLKDNESHPHPRFRGIFEDHPSTDARIARLNKLCPAS